MALSRPRLVAQGPNNFDAIRIAMALLVVWSHSFALYLGTEADEPIALLTGGAFNAGNLAVDVFFMVSGLLITQSFERSSSRWRFMRKRVARIYPGYLVATGLCAFVLLPCYAGVHYSLATIGKTLGLNILLQGWFVDPNPFVHNPGQTLNGALWSIPFEFWCYLGVLAVGTLGLLHKARRVWVLLGYGVVIALHVWCDATGRKPGGGFVGVIIGWPYLWLRMLPCFMAGMLVYLYRDKLPRSGWLAAAGVLVLIGAAHGSNLAVDVLSPVTIPYAMFYLAFNTRVFNAARYGDFSYGTYLYAFPIQQLLIANLNLPFPIFVATSMVLALMAGVISWHGVEKWFHRTRQPDASSGAGQGSKGPAFQMPAARALDRIRS